MVRLTAETRVPISAAELYLPFVNDTSRCDKEPVWPTAADVTQSRVAISETRLQQSSREIRAGQELSDASSGIQIITHMQAPLQTFKRSLMTPVLSAVFTEAELDTVD